MGDHSYCCLNSVCIYLQMYWIRPLDFFHLFSRVLLGCYYVKHQYFFSNAYLVLDCSWGHTFSASLLSFFKKVIYQVVTILFCTIQNLIFGSRFTHPAKKSQVKMMPEQTDQKTSSYPRSSLSSGVEGMLPCTQLAGLLQNIRSTLCCAFSRNFLQISNCYYLHFRSSS